MPTSKKVNREGEVVETDSSSGDSSSSAPLLSGGHHIDVFGFNLDVRQFLVTLALAYLMLGPQGTLALLIALAAYTIFVRVTRSNNSGSRSNGRGGGGRWGGRRGAGGGGRGGPNIKGVKDLPCDPKGG